MVAAHISFPLQYKLKNEAIAYVTDCDSFSILACVGVKLTRYQHYHGKVKSLANQYIAWGEAGVADATRKDSTKFMDKTTSRITLLPQR